MAGRFNSSIIAALRAICKLNASQRLALLRAADDSLVRSVCECALNTLKGNVALDRNQKNALIRHRNVLRRLACCDSGSWKTKKRLLIRHAKILPLLLTPIVDSR